MDINSTNFTGRLTADPELRYTADDKAVVNLRVAIGGRNDHVDFVDVTAWGPLAEIVAKHKSKGDQLAVSGRITSGEWTDNDGNRRYRTGVTANEIVFLARARQNTDT